MRSTQRRSAARDDGLRKQIQSGALQIDLTAPGAPWRAQEIDLTAKEFALLSFLASNAGRVYSREQLWSRSGAMTITAMRGQWTFIYGTCAKKLRRIPANRS